MDYRNGQKEELVDPNEDALYVLPHEGKKTSGRLNAAFETVIPKERGFVTNWGPVGFKKNNHPLSIMVTSSNKKLSSNAVMIICFLIAMVYCKTVVV